MAKITVTADCGNSPKNNLLKDFNIAFAQQDNSTILKMVSDDVVWEIVGHNTITGREAFQKAIEGIQGGQVKELIIERIISHGVGGAANGKIIMADDSTYAFCDMYEFKNAKGAQLRSIQSFNIAVQK